MEWMNNIQDPALKLSLGIADNKNNNKKGTTITAKKHNCSVCDSLEWRKELKCTGWAMFGCDDKEIYSAGLCKRCYDHCRIYRCKKCENYGVLSYNLLCNDCNEFEHTEEIKNNDVGTNTKMYWSTYHCEPLQGRCRETDCQLKGYVYADMRCISCRNADIKKYLYIDDVRL